MVIEYSIASIFEKTCVYYFFGSVRRLGFEERVIALVALLPVVDQEV